MVCLGNICRSPIAEGVLRAKIKEQKLDWVTSSAGTNGYHIGEAPHQYSQKVCNQFGIDISMQRAKKFTKQDFEDYDIIYAFAQDVYENIQTLATHKDQMKKVKYFLSELKEDSKESVPDPWYGDESGYLPVFQLIEKTCTSIITRYGG